MSLPSNRSLEAARNLLGLSQAQLAKRAGVAPVVISRYERGVGTPRIDNLLAIVDALATMGVSFVPEDDRILDGVIRHRSPGTVAPGDATRRTPRSPAGKPTDRRAVLYLI
jgi:transcriptional regulator with XRE-family HTH domain